MFSKDLPLYVGIDNASVFINWSQFFETEMRNKEGVYGRRLFRENTTVPTKKSPNLAQQALKIIKLGKRSI